MNAQLLAHVHSSSGCRWLLVVCLHLADRPSATSQCLTSFPPVLNILGSLFCPPCDPAPAPHSRRNLHGTCSAWTHIGIFLPWSFTKLMQTPWSDKARAAAEDAGSTCPMQLQCYILGIWLVGMVVSHVMVGLDDLNGLFQTQSFYDSMIYTSSSPP